MDLAMSKTREKYPLSKKKIIKKTISGMIAWTFLLVIAYLVLTVVIWVASGDLSLIGLTTLGFFSLIIIISGIEFLYQRWYFAVYYYDLAPDYIVIKKGPITPREITIPYERVQDIYVDQDILDRIFGLYDVHLSSATISSGMEAHIDGVEKAAADGLKGVLLNTVRQRISKGRGKSVLPSTTNSTTSSSKRP